MSSVSKTVVIDGASYALTHAPALVSLRAASTLANGFAPLLDGYRRSKGDEGERVIAGVAETLADPALSKNLESLCAAFAPYTQVTQPDGRSFTLADVFDRHFAGRIHVLLEWLMASVEYNLGGFLDEAKGRLRAAGIKTDASPSASPKPAATSG